MEDRFGGSLGNYRLVKLLGKGGFAEVYLGEHVHLGTLAAIKLLTAKLSDDEKEHFREEARTIARLKHPNIVRVLEFGMQGDLPYLVMDYAPNGTLRQRFVKGRKYDPMIILPYVQQVAGALQFAHERKLIHRDVKPENMLLGENKEVLLSDFGIAVVAQSSRHQDPQEIVGTLAYMAPEQIQAHPRPASDQYSLGVVIYEWLTGARPFSGSMSEILAKQISTPPPPIRDQIPNVSSELEQVVLTALAKDPKDRFASMRAFLKAFEQACMASGSLPLPEAFPPPPVPGEGVQSSPVISAPSAPSANWVTPSNPSNPSSPGNAISGNPPPAGSGPYPNAGPANSGPYLVPAFVPPAPPAAAPGIPSSPAPSYDAPAGSGAATPPGSRDADILSAPTIMGTFLPPVAPPSGAPSAPPTVPGWQPAQPGIPSAPGWQPAPPGIPPSLYETEPTILSSGPLQTGPTILSSSPLQTGPTLLSSQPEAPPFPLGAGVIPPAPLSPPPSPRVSRRKLLIAGVAGVAGLAAVGTGITWFVVSQKTPAQANQPSPTPTPTVPPILPLYVFRGHTGTVYNAAWSIDGSRIASAGDDHTVQIWDALSGSNVSSYKGHTGPVRAVSFSPDKQSLASASDDKTVQIISLKALTQTFVYTRHTDAVLAVAWAPVGTDVASGSLDQTVRVWSILSNVNLPFKQILSGSNNHATWVAWSPNGKYLAAASTDGVVRTWDGVTGIRHMKYGPQTGAINAVGWSADGTRIASGGSDRALRIWDAESGQTYKTIPYQTSVRSVAWSPDGKYIATATTAAVYILDATTYKTVSIFSGHKGAALSVAWSPDSQYVVSAGQDGTAQVWKPLAEA